jgi:hypothetical protein
LQLKLCFQITGLEAKAGMTRNMTSTIIHNKLFLYMNPSEFIVPDSLSKHSDKIFVEDGEIKYRVQQGEKEIILKTDEVATSIYKSMLSMCHFI